ncbi:hypothetical protein [Streptomyces sp. NPDC005799]|uniref:hypothetical protein n=1 Tax=Streptomyces sp. NPDC005799 TaxID=3154678 RepID=UPI0033C10AF1
MTSISRRSLLSCSGTTAAGAVLGATTSAQAADAETSSVDFPPNTEFTGTAILPNTEFTGTAILPDTVHSEGAGSVKIVFRVSCDTSVPGTAVHPIDVANALDEFLADRGWPAVTFYGTPEPVALN